MTKDFCNKLENIINEKIMTLEVENAELKQELLLAQAKLSVYERLSTIVDDKKTLGFGPPLQEKTGVGGG